MQTPAFVIQPNTQLSGGKAEEKVRDQHRRSSYHHTEFMPLPFRPLKLVLETIPCNFSELLVGYLF